MGSPAADAMGLFAFNNDYLKRWEGLKDEPIPASKKPTFNLPESIKEPGKDLPTVLPGKRKPPRANRKKTMPQDGIEE